MKMSEQELKYILDKHGKWLRSKENGKRANLAGADLTCVNLIGANLAGADLERANLYGANLTWTDLYGTSLEGKTIVTFQFGKHAAFYRGLDEIQIGCYKHSIEHWVSNFEAIGKSNGYSNDEIQKYGRFIKSCARNFKKESK